MTLSSCRGGPRQRVCHAAGVVPPPDAPRVGDPVGLQGVVAHFIDCPIEQVEGLINGLMSRDPTTNHRRVIGRCAMFGSVWQARGQQHSELLHPQVLEFVVDFEPGAGGGIMAMLSRGYISNISAAWSDPSESDSNMVTSPS